MHVDERACLTRDHTDRRPRSEHQFINMYKEPSSVGSHVHLWVVRPAGGPRVGAAAPCGGRRIRGMTAPTIDTCVTVQTGCVFAHRRTVTGMILAADTVGTKHYSAFHRLFAKAEWYLDELGVAVFKLIELWLCDGAVMLALDGVALQGVHAYRSASFDRSLGARTYRQAPESARHYRHCIHRVASAVPGS